jgi:hypothetical protein
MVVCFAVTQAAIGQSKSGFTYNGMVYTSWWFDEYGNYADPPIATGAATTSSDQLSQTAANYASVLVTQYVQTGTSTTIAPLVNKTPLDDQVVFAIQTFHNLGMKVFLKPHVDSVDGTWRGQFAPTSPPDWFASFQTFILHYAQIAQANNVEGLVFGTEYKSLSGSAYESYWAGIISQIRQVYSGSLAYGANATGPGDEYTTVSFWSLVDLIGVDGYFGLTTQSDPSVSQLVSAWSNSPENGGFNALGALENLHSTYNKPVIFTEIGYESTPGTNTEPWNSSLSDGYDPTEQADCYEAFFEVFSQQTAWMKGVFWWNWSIPALSAQDASYDPNGKPAGTSELPEWYGSATPNFRISSSAPNLAIAQNSSATETITVADEGGFTGSVALAVSGLPRGVTAILGTNPTNGSSVLTLTAGSAAAGGTSTVTITGTSGSLSASTTVSLTVTVSGCSIAYTISNQWQGGFGAAIAVTNTGTAALTNWTLMWPFANGQTITELWGGTATQSGTIVTVTNPSGSGSIPAGGSYSGMGFNGTWNNITNAVPANFTLNGTSCSGAQNPSFSLSAAAPSLSIGQAAIGTDTIAVADAGGFTGSVTLAASGLPTGVTAAFGTNPTTGSSVLTLTASAAAAAGTSTITIAGTSGTLSASTTIVLTITGTGGFTLSPTASSLSIAQGASGTDTITVADAGGFTGSVTLSASGLPSGVTAGFGTNPTTGSSALTLTASATATTGTSTVTITGTSGTLTASTAISLTVTGPPGFTLLASAPTLSIAPGASAIDTVTVTDEGGFTGSVTLAASGLPSGVTAAFGTNPTNGSSVLTLTASNIATAGTSTVTITGTSGTQTITTNVALSITSAGGPSCHIVYSITNQWQGGFGAAITIDNTGSTALSNWVLTWTFANGQTITQLWNGNESQSGANVTVSNMSYNGSIPAGGSYSAMGFNGTWNSSTNAVPGAFAINGTACK